MGAEFVRRMRYTATDENPPTQFSEISGCCCRHTLARAILPAARLVDGGTLSRRAIPHQSPGTHRRRFLSLPRIHRRGARSSCNLRENAAKRICRPCEAKVQRYADRAVERALPVNGCCLLGRAAQRRDEGREWLREYRSRRRRQLLLARWGGAGKGGHVRQEVDRRGGAYRFSQRANQPGSG